MEYKNIFFHCNKCKPFSKNNDSKKNFNSDYRLEF